MVDEYVRFEKVGDTGKTSVYYVIAAKRGDLLGIIKWYPQWRQYVFFPENATLYSAGCMKDISDFISDLMAGR